MGTKSSWVFLCCDFCTFRSALWSQDNCVSDVCILLSVCVIVAEERLPLSTEEHVTVTVTTGYLSLLFAEIFKGQTAVSRKKTTGLSVLRCA